MSRFLPLLLPFSMILLSGCDVATLTVENDFKATVEADIGMKNEKLRMTDLTPGQTMWGSRTCNPKPDFVYLSTRVRPQIIAYRIVDLCEPEKCRCQIKTSQLEARRRDLSVPWRQAGVILPPGARH